MRSHRTPTRRMVVPRKLSAKERDDERYAFAWYAPLNRLSAHSVRSLRMRRESDD